MAKTTKLTTLQPDRGFSQEGWDAVDFPELADEELAKMRPAKEVLHRRFSRRWKTSANPKDAIAGASQKADHATTRRGRHCPFP